MIFRTVVCPGEVTVQCGKANRRTSNTVTAESAAWAPPSKHHPRGGPQPPPGRHAFGEVLPEEVPFGPRSGDDEWREVWRGRWGQ